MDCLPWCQGAIGQADGYYIWVSRLSSYRPKSGEALKRWQLRQPWVAHPIWLVQWAMPIQECSEKFSKTVFDVLGDDLKAIAYVSRIFSTSFGASRKPAF
jgi:hypothetical protein